MKVYLLDKLVAMLILILNFEIWLYANYDVEQNVKVSSSIATDLILLINQKPMEIPAGTHGELGCKLTSWLKSSILIG